MAAFGGALANLFPLPFPFAVDYYLEKDCAKVKTGDVAGRKENKTGESLWVKSTISTACQKMMRLPPKRVHRVFRSTFFLFDMFYFFKTSGVEL